MVLQLRPFVCILAFLLQLLSGCNKEKEEELPVPESDVYTKEVILLLFTEMDYSEPRWQDSRMQVQLQLSRHNTSLPAPEVLLDTTIAWTPFRELPRKATPLRLSRKLNELHKEHDSLLLEVVKLVSVNGAETEFGYTQKLNHDQQQETVEVKL